MFGFRKLLLREIAIAISFREDDFIKQIFQTIYKQADHYFSEENEFSLIYWIFELALISILSKTELKSSVKDLEFLEMGLINTVQSTIAKVKQKEAYGQVK